MVCPAKSAFYTLIAAPQPNGSLRFTWSSVPGRAYRVVVSTDLLNWTPTTDWIQAIGVDSSLTLMPPSGSAKGFYRFEVRP